MRTDRLAAIALALALASYGASPSLAAVPGAPDDSSGPRAPAPPVVEITGAGAGCASDDGEVIGDASDLCSNPFTRAITAPFRGLASLFREDKKDGRKDDERDTRRADTKKRDDAPATAAAPRAPAADATSAANARPPMPGGDQITYAPAPAESSADSRSAPENAARSPESGQYAPSRVASPAASSNATSAEPFTPLIVGVQNDPVSQGRALIKHGLYEEAISELSVAAATGLNLVEANNLLGIAYDHRGQHGRAREFYERALTLAPKDANVLSNLGYSLYLDDRPREALAKLKLAARLDPSSPEIYNNLGVVYAKLDKYDDAFRNFAQAGGDLYARVRTASLLEQAGRDREAIRHYEAARKLDPASNDVLRHLINLYDRTGQRDKAETVERSLDRPKAKSSSSTTD